MLYLSAEFNLFLFMLGVVGFEATAPLLKLAEVMLRGSQ